MSNEESTLDMEDVRRAVRSALAEDLRYGPDVTTEATIPSSALAEASIVSRGHGVFAGGPIALTVLDEVLGPDGYDVVFRSPDGTQVLPGTVVLTIRAPLRGLLTAERTALNFLCHLSGVATATASWVAAVKGTGCRIRDSRKTLPGLRLLQKYAVRCGGGENHRFGLGESVLIKDNHVRAAGSVTKAIELVRRHITELACEVEVDNLEQLDEILALPTPVDLILLDNFSVAQCVAAVRRVKTAGSPSLLEASGGLTLDKAESYASTGVDYLAVGALTHSAPALDLGLDL